MKIDRPSDEEIGAAFDANQHVVFACFISPSHARIALSEADVVKDLTDPEVKRCSSGPSVIENFVKAEQWIAERATRRKASNKSSVAERLAAARKQLHSPSAGAAAASATSRSAPSTDSDSLPTGQ